MNRDAYDFRYDAQGVIDYGYYRAKAQTARFETRVRIFRRIFAFLLGKRAPLPARSRATGIASLSY